MSGPLQIISPAVVDINFGTLALKMKTGHFKRKRDNLISMKIDLQYENITSQHTIWQFLQKTIFQVQKEHNKFCNLNITSHNQGHTVAISIIMLWLVLTFNFLSYVSDYCDNPSTGAPSQESHCLNTNTMISFSFLISFSCLFDNSHIKLIRIYSTMLIVSD